MAWVNFTSTNNPTHWYVEANAIDGNTGTYSTGSGVDFSEYLQLNLSSPVTSEKLQIWIEADPIANANASVIVDTSPDGSSWDTVKDGEILNSVINGYQEISYTERTVSAIRIKRNSDTAVYVNMAQVFEKVSLNSNKFSMSRSYYY